MTDLDESNFLVLERWEAAQIILLLRCSLGLFFCKIHDADEEGYDCWYATETDEDAVREYLHGLRPLEEMVAPVAEVPHFVFWAPAGTPWAMTECRQVTNVLEVAPGLFHDTTLEPEGLRDAVNIFFGEASGQT